MEFSMYQRSYAGITEIKFDNETQATPNRAKF
jgi:hypothetical protein